MKTISLAIPLLWIGITGVVFAAEPEEWRAPPGTRWKRELTFDGDAIQFSLFSGETITAVFYAYDPRDGSLLRSRAWDAELGIVATPPGTTLDERHPEFVRPLEEEIVELLRELSFEGTLPRKHFHQEMDGRRWVSSYDELWRALTQFEADEIAFERFRAAQSGIVRNARAVLIQNLSGFSDLLTWANDLDWLDVVEPQISEETGVDRRIDAFTRFPIETLARHGCAMVDILERVAQEGSGYPLEWLLDTSIPKEVRLSLVMLLTHNHGAERRFVQGVALKCGGKRAAGALVGINDLYRRERLYWAERGRSRFAQNKWPVLVESSGIRFLDDQALIECDVGLKPRVAWPRNGIPFSGDPLTSEWVPFSKRYHYYGAVVVTIRLSDTLSEAPQPVITAAVEELGRLYKKFSGHIQDRDAKAAIDRYYQLGAQHGHSVWKWMNEK